MVKTTKVWKVDFYKNDDENYMQKQRQKSTRYYETKKDDPDFKAKERERARLNYIKKKLAKNQDNLNT
jgi:hypothetical protein